VGTVAETVESIMSGVAERVHSALAATPRQAPAPFDPAGSAFVQKYQSAVKKRTRALSKSSAIHYRRARMDMRIRIEDDADKKLVARLMQGEKVFRNQYRQAKAKVVRKLYLPAVREAIPKSERRNPGTPKHLKTAIGARASLDTVTVRVGSKDRWYAAIVHNVSRGNAIKYGRLPVPFYDIAWKKRGPAVLEALRETTESFTAWLARGGRGKFIGKYG